MNAECTARPRVRECRAETRGAGILRAAATRRIASSYIANTLGRQMFFAARAVGAPTAIPNVIARPIGPAEPGHLALDQYILSDIPSSSSSSGMYVERLLGIALTKARQPSSVTVAVAARNPVEGHTAPRA
ncbi:hypothetical protein BDZ89DRAFT_1073910 [Hymenopellis radicata]|nr:hypothetical protein BDZ89DRAFT_1073910 [Hymenopellis radicata]